MDQLKNALIDAGLVSKDKLKEMQRKKMTKRHIKKQRQTSHEHQLRITCELCNKTAPDVEYYEHRSGLLGNAKWLCIPCADNNQIDDQFRQTAQSTQSKQRIFRRLYGRTKTL